VTFEGSCESIVTKYVHETSEGLFEPIVAKSYPRILVNNFVLSKSDWVHRVEHSYVDLESIERVCRVKRFAAENTYG